MKINALKCKKCSDTIFSRAQHDFHYCSCGATFVDGGFEYIRYGWEPDVGRPEEVEIEVEATKAELYQDWNKRTDKFGIIKNEVQG